VVAIVIIKSIKVTMSDDYYLVEDEIHLIYIRTWILLSTLSILLRISICSTLENLERYKLGIIRSSVETKVLEYLTNYYY